MNNNQEKILQYFFTYPSKQVHIRELAKILKLNPNTIINLTKDVIKKKLLIREKTKPLVYLSANTENINFIRLKKIHNLKSIYSTKLLDHLIEFYKNPEVIVLIGSYARGDDFEKSDIDIVIITDSEKYPEISEFSRKFKRNIQIVLTDYNKMSDEFYSSLINGIILHGFLRIK
jgi:predicted nucleotidyltransferase